ncbi:MAG: hypothetical protein A3H35_10650 [Betaproteobacteria bacterium RIFCSPLOWO2_02_FULL_62_17]|nr:MAG: hypothetical protein A3H35_10650 [Betaproteobacteria bacterium RIFCSPLOWO2_02_FULL_62_17]
MEGGWFDEMRSAYLYREISSLEKGTPREALFRELAGEAESQAAIWAKKSGAPAGSFEPDMRTRVVVSLLRRYGPRALRGMLAAMKVRGVSVYTHAAPGHPSPTSIEDMASRHKGIGSGGNLRAAIFGVNDGAVSNAGLILGMAGASADEKVVLLSGIAGLLAGAFSMAAGEYVSVRSQREMYEHQIDLERKELAEYPEEEAEELALIYAARGMPIGEARSFALKTVADPERALLTLAREELGLNPDELGSPWGAASSSFGSFAVGAIIPLLPFLLWPGHLALWISIAATAIALFAVGAAISLFTGRSAFRDGFRMLAIGALAGAVTYTVGSVIGVAVI